MKQLDGTKKLVTYTKGADGETISQDDFTLEWYKDEACTEKISVEEMGNDKPAPDSKRYYLKVTYNKLNNDLTYRAKLVRKSYQKWLWVFIVVVYCL